MRPEPEPAHRSSGRQTAAALTLLAGVVTFLVAAGILGTVLAAAGWVGPVELVLVVAAAALVTWLVVRRIRRSGTAA